MLIFDVGGSFCKITSTNSKDNAIKRSIVRTPACLDGLISLFEEHASLMQCKTVIIGIPGPIKTGQDIIFLPPLNYSLSLRRIHSVFSRIGYKSAVVNDAVLRALLTSVSVPYSACRHNPSILLTIGTSLGSTIIVNTSLSASFVPIELAHVSLPSCLDLSWINSDICPLFAGKNASSLFSAAGIYLSCDLESSIKAISITDSLYKIRDVNLLKHRAGHINLGLLLRWFTCLTSYIENIFPDIGQVFITGGPLEILNSAPDDFLMKIAKLGFIYLSDTDLYNTSTLSLLQEVHYKSTLP